MSTLAIRKNVQGYARDTYLGTSVVCDSRFRLIDCLIGSSQWGVSAHACKAHQMHDLSAQTIYPEPFYDQLLKPAILRRFGLVELLNTKNIFLGHGSFNLAERLIHKLINPGIMLGVGPQFNEIPSEFIAAGGVYKTIMIEGPDYAFPMEELKKALSGGVSVLYLDNPNNPLGRFLSIAELRALVEVADKFNVIMLIDEAYGDFIDDDQSAAKLVPYFRNLVVLRSFSKALGLAAARIGYMFLSTEIAQFYQPLDVPFEPTLLSAELARATIEDVEFIAHVRTSATYTKSLLMPILEKAGFTILPTHSATSIMTLYKKGCDVVSLFASRGISVEPGVAFNKTHMHWDNSYCRLRLPHNADLEEFQSRLQL